MTNVYNIYCDESCHLEHDRIPVMLFGAVWCPQDKSKSISKEVKQIAQKLIETLRGRGFDVKTQISPAGKFWPAEEYHQDYYKKTKKVPTCQLRKKLWP